MSLRPTLLFALPMALFGAPDARSETGSASAERPAPVAASPERIQLAQQPWGGNKWPGGNPPPGQGAQPNNDGDNDAAQRKRAADQARQKALEQQQQQRMNAQQAREKAIQDRQNAAKNQQLQREQAKQKAIEQQQQQRMNAQQAREKAIQDRQNAAKNQQLQREQAKQKAIEQQQQQRMNAQQAREKAIQDRQDAAKNQQLQREQAKQKAIQDRQDAIKAQEFQREQARQKANQDRQNAADRNQQGQPPRKDGFKPGGGWGAQPKAYDRNAADNEFNRARDRARDFDKGGPNNKGGPGKGDNRGRDMERWQADSARKFEDIRKGRQERTMFDGRRRAIIEPDNRVIVRENNREYIRHNEYDRFKKTSREVRRERRKDGLTMIVTAGLAGALIYSLMDDDGRLVRRSRRYDDGREVMLIDNEGYYDYRDGRYARDDDYDAYVDLPPPRVRIPQDDYIVDYGQASQEDVYDALMAPPVERLERGYSLDEVRRSYSVLERMRRVDLDSINFNFGAWDVGEDQYPKLERIANAMQRILKRSPDEIFLIEGHTDAVGSDIDNLSLSDRRAESVAIILSDYFNVPPENLTTQGYGEQYLKVMTEEPSRINRRVSVRRITPLLSRRSADRYAD